MTLDHHVHSQFDGFAYADAFELADLANRNGITHLGFAESFPLPAVFSEQVGDEMYMHPSDFPHYVDTARGVRAEYADQNMAVLVGTEVDFLPEFAGDIHRMLAANGQYLDFTTLGNHFLGEHMFTISKPEWQNAFEAIGGSGDLDTAYRRYYAELKAGVETGWFDILSHMDMIKKFDDRPGAELAERHRADIEAVLDAMAATGHMALELNTSGFDLFCREQFPSEPILRWALDRDIPITVGSDCHTAGHVARHFDRARDILERLGVRDLVFFRKRQPYFVPVAKLWSQTA